jgi:hypothetical protein
VTVDEIRALMGPGPDQLVIDRLVAEMGEAAALRILTGPPAWSGDRRSPEARAAALAVLEAEGEREASRLTGIPRSTLRSWRDEASAVRPPADRIIR